MGGGCSRNPNSQTLPISPEADAVLPAEWVLLSEHCHGEPLTAPVLKRTRRLARKDGIPPAIRPLIWRALLRDHGARSTVRPRPAVADAAADAMQQISKDLHRTLPSEPTFTELHREQLNRVLQHVASSDGEVGYVQGMNSIAALLLLHSASEADATVSASILISMLRSMYSPGMPLLHRLLTVLDTCASQSMPELYTHFCNEGLAARMFAVPWFLTLFAHSLPVTTVARLWDLLLSSTNLGHMLVQLSLALLQFLHPVLIGASLDVMMAVFCNLHEYFMPATTQHSCQSPDAAEQVVRAACSAKSTRLVSKALRHRA